MLTLIQHPFHPPLLLQWHIKDPGHSCRWQVTHKHAYTPDPIKSEWADYAAVHCQAQCGNLSGNELTRNFSGNTRPKSYQFTEPLRIDPGIKSEITVHELITTFKKKEAQAEIEWSNILTKSLYMRKEPPIHLLTLLQCFAKFRKNFLKRYLAIISSII